MACFVHDLERRICRIFDACHMATTPDYALIAIIAMGDQKETGADRSYDAAAGLNRAYLDPLTKWPWSFQARCVDVTGYYEGVSGTKPGCIDAGMRFGEVLPWEVGNLSFASMAASTLVRPVEPLDHQGDHGRSLSDDTILIICLPPPNVLAAASGTQGAGAILANFGTTATALVDVLSGKVSPQRRPSFCDGPQRHGDFEGAAGFAGTRSRMPLSLLRRLQEAHTEWNGVMSPEQPLVEIGGRSGAVVFIAISEEVLQKCGHLPVLRMVALKSFDKRACHGPVEERIFPIHLFAPAPSRAASEVGLRPAEDQELPPVLGGLGDETGFVSLNGRGLTDQTGSQLSPMPGGCGNCVVVIGCCPSTAIAIRPVAPHLC